MWDNILEIVKNPKFYIPIITLVIMIVLIKITNKSVKKLLVKNATKIETKKRNTIVTLFTNIFKYMIIILGALIVLSAWGVNVTSILAGLGIAGVVAGLALQDALKDIIMGCNIILDNFYVVGDYINYDGFIGEVIEFGLKNTKIKDANNYVLVVSNRNIDKVINYSQSKFMLPIIINSAYEDDLNKTENVINKIIEIAKRDEKIKDLVYVGVSSLADSSVQYKLLLYCNPVDQYQLERDLYRLIKVEFDKNDLKIPYNQLEVHNGK